MNMSIWDFLAVMVCLLFGMVMGYFFKRDEHIIGKSHEWEICNSKGRCVARLMDLTPDEVCLFCEKHLGKVGYIQETDFGKSLIMLDSQD